ncbi:hypothetical protein BJ684DRAFT_19172 [Piptocephalis cylindrospora]|uniref:Large ribosomal subunit protein mL67 n=1 Tax=Piptocephalis cylindrospora TaxID=1907219 RepID=A0A4P9Y8V4_9FUNG|nr:hypothetical protein BJ684DRAFT_19172 [Piptocephalis cylindrospora]|eukprot:RKP14420.1 hypothetical protein BJ684DRAFT_19172 [Piptocephalis cylindrospora]
MATKALGRARGLYFYRNIRTQQVIINLSEGLRDDSLRNQLPDPTTRPPSIRKDLWRPMVVAMGLEESVARGLRQAILEMPVEKRRDPEYLKKPIVRRRVLEQDMVKTRVEQLRHVLTRLEGRRVLQSKPAPEVRLFWDDPQYQGEESEGTWPSSVTHDALVLKRGRMIQNEAIIRAPISEEVQARVQARKDHKARYRASQIDSPIPKGL